MSVLPRYALNNFSKAFRALANKGLGKRRWLCSEYVEHLCHLEASDMPEGLKDKFIEFKRHMETARESCNAEHYRLAVQAMDDSQVIEITARILAMHEALVHEASLDLLAQRTGGWVSPISNARPRLHLVGSAGRHGK
jgi:hypothetical protein